MAMVEQDEYSETFGTEAEAEAFVAGLEFFGDEHVAVHGIEPNEVDSPTEAYIVHFRRFA